MEATDPDAWYHPGATMEAALPGGWRRLAGCRHFATDSLRIDRELAYQPDPHFELLICVEGAGALNGEPFTAGAVWLVPSSSPPVEVRPEGSLRLLRSYVPARG
jgi:mannose-6-phosphate isomerase class I